MEEGQREMGRRDGERWGETDREGWGAWGDGETKQRQKEEDREDEIIFQKTAQQKRNGPLCRLLIFRLFLILRSRRVYRQRDTLHLY